MASAPDAVTAPRAWFDTPAPPIDTPPEADDAVRACVLAAIPWETFPIAPDALETLGACILAAEPDTPAALAAAPAAFCCVGAPDPEISTRPTAESELAA